jgi:AsmA protein
MANSDSKLLQNKHEPRFSRRLLIALVAAFGAVLALIAIVPAFLDHDQLRTRLLSEIGRWTGTELASAGSFKLTLFPDFKATLNDVKSIKPQTAIQISAKSIEVGLSAWPALIGRIESSSVKFVEADFTINAGAVEALKSAGLQSPIGNAVALATLRISADATSPNLFSIANQKLGKVSLERSKLTVVSGDNSKEQLSNVNASINWANLQGAALIEAEAEWRGETVKFSTQVAQPLLFAAGGNSSMTVNFVSEPMTLSFQGKSNLVSDFFADGDLSWKTPSMARFLQWMGAGSTAGEAIGDIELSAKLVTKEGKLLLNDLAMQVSGSAASGALEIDPVVKPIKSSGTLAFKSVDLAALAAALPIGLDNQSSNELRLLDDLDLDIRLSAEQATIAGYEISNAAGAIRIAKGEASVDLGTGEIAGGTIMGRLELSGPATAKNGQLTVNLNKVHMDQVSVAQSGIPVASGALTGKLEIAGPYKNLQTLIASGKGSVRLELDKGVIRNFNMATMQAAMNEQGLFELPTVYVGMSEASAFSIDADIKNGVAIINNTDVTIDGRRVSLSGAIPLLSRGIALTGKITDLEPTKATAPKSFFVGGTWARPLVTTQTAK